MKLLQEFPTPAEAQIHAAELEAKGILTFVSNAGTKNLKGVGVVRVGLWAVLPEQHEDALSLLKDPDHEVLNPLTQEDLLTLKQQANSSPFHHFKPLLNGLAGIGLLALLVWVVVALASNG